MSEDRFSANPAQLQDKISIFLQLPFRHFIALRLMAGEKDLALTCRSSDDGAVTSGDT